MATSELTLVNGTFKQVRGEHYGTPKELWGFRTRPRGGGPKAVATAFLRANARRLGLEPRLGTIEHQKTIRSVGTAHVIFQQRAHGLRVHRAYVTVHVSRDRSVYLLKNRAVPAAMLPAPPRFALNRTEAVRRARRAVGRTQRLTLQDTEQMWYPLDDALVAVWRIRLGRRAPPEEWIAYLDADTGETVSLHDNVAHARAWVFDPSPVTAIGDHATLLSAGGRPRRPPSEAYRTVRLHGLGDGRRLDGRRVTTAATDARRRLTRRGNDLFMRSHEKGFEEVMAYYHVDEAIRYLERLGYRGQRRIFRAPLRINVNGTRQDNSWYSPFDRTLTFGTGAIDDAEDAETILHELGHAIQDAICPDFGQSAEAGAMGEGFGDYLAASFFADRKPDRYRAAVVTWDGLLIGLDEGFDPPCLRRVDNDWTYDDFNEDDSEHENGEVWSATLWDVFESVGRDVADRLIIESHFQLDGFTTFARGARAILDADDNLYGGAHRRPLRRVFRRRRIAPI